MNFLEFVLDVFTKSSPFEIPTTLPDLQNKVVHVLARHSFEVIGVLWAFQTIAHVNFRYWIGAKALPSPLKSDRAAPTSYSVLRFCFFTWGIATALYFAGYSNNGEFPWWSFAVLPVLWWAAMKTIRQRGSLSVHRTAKGGITSIVIPGTYTKSSEIFLGVGSLIAATCSLHLANQPQAKPTSWLDMKSFLSLYSMMFVTSIFTLGSPYPTLSKPRRIPLRNIMACELVVCLSAISILWLLAYSVKGECGVDCKDDMAIFENNQIDILLRALVIPYQALSTARMISLFLRLDFAHRDTKIELNTISVESIPPSNRNGAIEDGVIVPENISGILPIKPAYYKTALRTWTITYLLFLFFILSVLPRFVVAYFGLMVCSSVMNAAVLVRAFVQGGRGEVKRVLGYVEIEWIIEPVDLLPLLKQDEKKRMEDGQMPMETMQ